MAASWRLGLIGALALAHNTVAMGADIATTVEVVEFLKGRGATVGCLLDKSSGKTIAAYLDKGGAKTIAVMQPDSGGTCLMGGIRLRCTELKLTADAARATSSACSSCAPATPGEVNFRLCGSMPGELKILRAAIRAMDTEGFVGGSLGTKAAMLFRGAAAGAASVEVPAVLVDAAGQRAELEGTTEGIRGRSPDDAVAQIESLGLKLDTIAWIGVDSKRPVVTKSGGVRWDGAHPGARLISTSDLANRLQGFKSAAEVEDLTEPPETVKRKLLLLLLDPKFDAKDVVQKGYAFSPEIYLLE